METSFAAKSTSRAATLLVVYSAAMLAPHTILHVEDRYGVPLLPLCALLLVMYGENCTLQFRASGWRGIGPLALYAVAAWAMFVVQIIARDQTSFY